MPKTFPIRLEVEEIALGAVLRKLNDMPGVVKLDLDVGLGGQGAGRAQLEKAAAAAAPGRSQYHQAALQLLQSGPKHIREIAAAVGGAPARAYGVMHQLRIRGESKPIGKGFHELTGQAAGKAAAPVKAPRRKTGRASPGTGPILIRAALDSGPLSPRDLSQKLAAGGMGSGALARAKRDGLVKKNGSNLYELTAKGAKIELGA